MPVYFLTNNLIDTATLTGSNAISGFPVTNVVDVRPTTRFKTDGIVMHDCETADWAQDVDSPNEVLNPTNFKQGANSLDLGKTGTTLTYSVYLIDPTSSAYDGTGKSAYVWVYVYDKTELTGSVIGNVHFYSSANNGYRFLANAVQDVVNDGTDGWNKLGGLLSGASTIGTPVITSLDRLELWFFVPTTGDTVALGNVKMDHWHLTGGRVDVDLGSAQAITAAAIAGHDLLSTDTEIKLYYSDDASTYTEQGEFTYSADAMAMFFASSSHRYWRFEFAFTTGDTREIGRLFLGTYVQPTRGIQLGWSRALTDSSQSKRAFSGTQFADNRNKWWEADFKLSHDPAVTLDPLRAALSPLGISKSLWISLDPENNPSGPLTLYGRFKKPWSESEPLNSNHDASFSFAEDI